MGVYVVEAPSLDDAPEPRPYRRSAAQRENDALRLAWHKAGRPGEGKHGWTASEACDAWISMQLPEAGDA